MRPIFRSGLTVLALVCLAAGPALAAPMLSLGARTLTLPTSHAGPVHGLVDLLAVPLALGGAIVIKDLGALSAKFVRNASNAAGDYTAGVQNAGGDWEAGTKAAEPNYEQGVQAAIARKAFGKGVTGSAGKYQTNATKLGSGRYPAGVANAQAAWQAGFAPYAQVLQGMTLPPKGPRRSPQNQARANAVAVALGTARTGQQ